MAGERFVNVVFSSDGVTHQHRRHFPNYPDGGKIEIPDKTEDVVSYVLNAFGVDGIVEMIFEVVDGRKTVLYTHP